MCGLQPDRTAPNNNNVGYIPLPGRRWPGPFHPPWYRCTSRTGGQRQPARCGRTAGCKGVGVGACIVMHCNVKRGGSVASAMHQPRPPLHMECGSKRKVVVGRTSQRQWEGQVPLPNTYTHSYATGLNKMACYSTQKKDNDRRRQFPVPHKTHT